MDLFTRAMTFMVMVLFIGINVIAQDNLVLYTKAGCSNCAYAKSTLSANKIRFHEFNVADVANAKAMLDIIKAKKYKGTISMPVIVLNGNLQYPAISSADTFIYLPLYEVVNKLIAINSLKDNNVVANETGNSEDSGDCDYEAVKKDSVHYLICKNFKSVEEARHFVEVLNHDGYKNAEIISWQKFQRVAVAKSEDKKSLLSMYNAMLKRYGEAYILSIADAE